MDLRSYMWRCIELAENGLGRVAPNPMVGCVIVNAGRIIGEGYHQKFGGPHAEVNAINAVKNKVLLEESTLFVNLEPCAHFGKTPPCADLIIASKIPKVVVAQRDPNPKVAGRGIERMKSAGINVTEGIYESEAAFLNRRFLTHQKEKRPYIILKWAQSADGFMDRDRHEPNDPKINWISHPSTKKLVHLWRSQEPAILVGRNTIVNDNPKLDTREVEGTSPMRVVLSSSGKIPKNSNVLSDGKKTVILNSKILQKIDYVDWVKIEGDFIRNALKYLSEIDISSILVEGGAQTLNTFISQNLWDEARIIQSANRIGSGLKAPVIGAENITIPMEANGFTEMYGQDRITRLFRK